MHDRQRTRVRVRAITLTLAAALCGGAVYAAVQHAAAQSAATADSVVVATVNGEKITRGQIADDLISSQLDKLTATDPRFKDAVRPTAGSVGALVLQKMQAHPGQPVSVTRSEVVNWLFKDNPPIVYNTVRTRIMETAVKQEARKEGVVVTPAELNQQMQKTLDGPRKQYNMQGSDAQVLHALGVSAAFLRPILLTQYSADKMVRHDLEKQIGHAISDADYIQVRHVLVMPANPPANPSGPAVVTTADTEKRFADAKPKIDAIAADIKSGKITFEKAAETNNADATKFRGGDLGVMIRDMPGWDPDLVKAAFQLKEGEVSAPVRSKFGWHLIRVDKVGRNIPAVDKQKALDQVVQQRVAARMNEILQAAKVTNTVKPPQQPGMMGSPQRPQ